MYKERAPAGERNEDRLTDTDNNLPIRVRSDGSKPGQDQSVPVVMDPNPTGPGQVWSNADHGCSVERPVCHSDTVEHT